MSEFNYQEYLKNNPLLTEGENCDCKSTSCSCDAPKTDLNEMDVEGEAGPVVDQYFTYIMDYFNNHHDDIYDMNNFLTALKHVTTTVTTTRDRFAKEIGFYGTDDERNDEKYNS